MTDPKTRRDGSFYDEIGGTATFHQLVEKFYEGVATDEVLRPLYPEQDLGPAHVRLQMFLEQYWGGPGTYSQLRGHPRLRMRHVPFRIGEIERDHWLGHMSAALDSIDITDAQRDTLWSYLVMAANSLINAPNPT